MAVVQPIAGIGVPKAWATSTITLSRNDSTPRTLNLKPGDDVRFINATGGQAQLWFGGRDGLRLFVSPGGTLVKFDRADSSGRRNGLAEGGCDGGSAAIGSGSSG